mgnify:CR=1 FL=1
MTYGRYNFRQIKRTAVALLMITAIAVLLFTAFCPSAGAVGLVDDSVDAAHEYSRYPLENYQLDFYVDNGWDWLPWNWIDGIGKQVMYGLYCITNFIWTINLYLSNASGYLVQEHTGWILFQMRRTRSAGTFSLSQAFRPADFLRMGFMRDSSC